MRQVLGFSTLPGLSMLSNLVIFPLLSSRFGTPGWTSVSIGQSIGAAASIVCSLHWPIEGPGMTAALSGTGRLALYRSSVRQRLLALLAAAPVILLVVVLARPGLFATCALVSLATAANALTPSWHFIGVGDSKGLILAEGIPRLVINAAVLALLLLGAPLEAYPLCLMMVSVTSLLIADTRIRSRKVATPFQDQWASPPPSRKSVGLATGARSADAAYSYLATAVVSGLAPRTAIPFIAVDRLTKLLLNALAAIPQGLAHWALTGTQDRSSRLRQVSMVLVVMTLAVMAVALPLGPLVAHLMFAGTVHLRWSHAALFAFLLGAVFLTRALLMLVVVPLGAIRTGYLGLIGASVLGLPLLAWTAASGGGEPALISVTAVNALLAIGLLLVCLLRIRRVSQRKVSPVAAE